MSFLSSSFSNSKPSHTSRASEPMQVSSVAVLSDLFTAGFSGHWDLYQIWLCDGFLHLHGRAATLCHT